MGDGIYAAMSGAMVRSRALDVVANNVANAPTPGFYADMVAVREQPAQPAGEPARPETDLRMATLDAVTQSWRPGPLEETGAPLDLAIDGDGLIAVQAGDEVRYTRGGTMVLDEEGTLRTTAGHALLDIEGRPVRVPQDAVGEPVIDEDGTVQVGEQTVGRLRMVWFDPPDALSRGGDGTYTAAAGAQPAEATGRLQQGYIEQANVNVVRGMIDLVSISRSYEATVRAMESFSNIDKRTARELGKG